MAASDGDASLHLNIDYSKVYGATLAMAGFTTASGQAADAAKKHASATEDLNRQMQEMVAMQRQTNELLQQNIQTTRQAGQAADEHAKRMHLLAGGVTAAAGAYALLHTHAAAAADAVSRGPTQQTIQGYQQMGDAIGQLTQRLQALQAAQAQHAGFLRSIGAIAGGAVNIAGDAVLGLAVGGPAGAIAGGLAGAGSQFGNMSTSFATQIAQVQAQMRMMQTLTTNVQSPVMEQGVRSLERMGLSEQQSVDLIQRMQQNLQGVGVQWELARKSLGQYHADLTNAATATTSFLQNISKFAPGPFRTQALQEVLGDTVSPAVLRRSQIEQMTPRGPEGKYEEAQARMSDTFNRTAETLEEQLRELKNKPGGTRWGLPVNQRGVNWPMHPIENWENGNAITGPLGFLAALPGAGINAAYRYGQDISQLWTPGSPEKSANSTLSIQRQLYWEQLARGKMGFGSYLGNEARSLGQTGRNWLNPLLGGALGYSGPSGVAYSHPQAPPIPEAAWQNLAMFTEMGGRGSAEAIQTRLEQAQMRGKDIVKSFEGHPEEQKKAEDEVANTLSHLAYLLRREAEPVQTAVEALYRQNRLLQLPQQQRAEAGYVANLREEQRNVYGSDLGKVLEDAAKQTFEARQSLTGQNTLHNMQTQVSNQEALAQAYQEGGSAVAKITAEQQAYADMLANKVTPGTQQAADAAERLVIAFEGLIAKAADFVNKTSIAASDASTMAVAAAHGPAAERQAEIAAKVEDFTRPLLQAAPKQVGVMGEHAGSYVNEVREKAAQLRASLEKILADTSAKTLNEQAHAYHEQSATFNQAMSRSQTLDLIERDESAGRNVRNYRYDPTHTAQGYFQITNTNWRAYGDNRYANAMSAPYGVQRAAAGRMYDKFGASPWADYDPRLRADLGLSPILAARAQGAAQRELEATGINPTPQQVSAQKTQDLNTQFQNLAMTLAEQNREEQASLSLQAGMSHAIMEGPQAVQDLNTQMKVAAEMTRLGATATEQMTPAMQRLRTEVEANAQAQQKFAAETAAAHIQYQFQQQQQGTARAISAFQSGGLNAMQLQEQSQGYYEQLMATGNYTPGQAQQLAQQMATAARQANDMKAALADASQTISQGMTGGINDVIDGLEGSIGRAHGLKVALLETGMKISEIGVDTFIKKPLDLAANNLASGRGFNFNEGNSGLSYWGALGQAWNSMTGGGSGGDAGTGGVSGGPAATAAGQTAAANGAITQAAKGVIGLGTSGAGGTGGGITKATPLPVEVVNMPHGGMSGQSGGHSGAGNGTSGQSGGQNSGGGLFGQNGWGWTGAAAAGGAGLGALIDHHSPLTGALIGGGAGAALNLIGGMATGNGFSGGGILGDLFGSSSSGGPNSGGVTGFSSGHTGNTNNSANPFGLGLNLLDSVGSKIKGLFSGSGSSGSGSGSGGSWLSSLFGGGSNASNGGSAPGYGGGDASTGASTFTYDGNFQDSDFGDEGAGGAWDLSAGGGADLSGGADVGAVGGLGGEDFDSGAGSDFSVDAFHLGGPALPGYGVRRYGVPPEVFWNAPRLHSGLRPGEFPAVLQTGETVLPRGGSPAPATPAQASGVRDVHVYQSIYTPDAHSFRATAGQTALATQRSVNAAARNT